MGLFGIATNSVQMLVLVAVLTVAVFAVLYFEKFRYEVEGIRIYRKDSKKSWTNLLLVLAAALLVKLIFAAAYEGHGTDMTCFSAWSDMIFKDGFWNFYHSDSFTDYPPGYMAMLWGIGALRSIFNLDVATGAGRCVIKLIPILFDLGAGALLYKIAKRKFSEGSSLILSATYVLSPVVVLDSSAWGQVDGVFTFFLLLVCYLCMEEKRIFAYFAFVAGVLIKPQMIMFAPLLIWTIIEQVFLKDFSKEKMFRDLVGGVLSLVAMVVFTLPFGVDKVFSQYVNTLGSYPYATINAYNFWALLGQNWQPQANSFLGVSASSWGTLAILVSVALSAVIFFRLKDDNSRYFTSMAVLLANMFLFSVRMHERYLFPALVLMLAAFLVKPTKQLFFTYVGFSAIHFLNVGHVLWAYVEENENTAPNGPLIGITAVLTILMFAYLIYASFSVSVMEDLKEVSGGKKKRNTLPYLVKNPKVKEKELEEVYKQHIHATRRMPKFTKWDYIVLFGILVLYSVFAFRDLGDTKAPETYWQPENGNSEIVLDLGKAKDIGMIYTFLGAKEDRMMTLEMSEDGKNYDMVGTVRATSVFCWDALKTWDKESQEEGADDYNLAKDYRYIRLSVDEEQLSDTFMLNELVILDKDGNWMKPVNASEYKNLFDEQDCFEPQSDLPETVWKAEKAGETVTLDLGADSYFSMLRGYSTEKANQRFEVEVAKSANDGEEPQYQKVGTVVSGEADGFSRLSEENQQNADTYSFANDSYRYIRLTTLSDNTSLNELVLTDTNGNTVKIRDHIGGDSLFDEQDGYRKAITFRSGTYFDEIYHARTAYEIAHGMSNYEWTHPPLGKVFISLGVRMFGMNPFGWRIIGVLFGIGMIPFMYFFGRRLFKNRTWAAGALTFLFTFDFMHFTQTRIATIDVYGTFFIIAMFYFMYQYSQTSFYDTKLWKTFIPLGLSAVMMGLGCASKWTAVYASAGLAVFFFAIMGWRIFEYHLAKKNPTGETEGIAHKHIIEVFKKKLLLTLGFCVIFFVFVAGTIYVASYVPFEDSAKDNTERFYEVTDENYEGFKWENTFVSGLVDTLRDHSGNPVAETVGKMLNNQHAMYEYHSKLEATHPWQSSWYEWPTMIRPMYYYCQTLRDGMKEGISAFGNPLVWWAGIPALILILLPFGRRRSNRLGSKTSQWLQSIGCEFFVFLALWSVFVKQSSSNGGGDSWKLYGPFLIVLGVASALYIAYQLVTRGDKKALFMVFAYAVQLLPWILVPRCTFAYHYFPSVPFVAMMIVYCMVKLVDSDKKWFKWCMVYLAVAFFLFLVFYPVLSGQPIYEQMARDGLRWLEGWQLVS